MMCFERSLETWSSDLREIYDMAVLRYPSPVPSPFEEPKSLKHKVTSWFKTVTKPKCTCPKQTHSKPRKEKKLYYVVEPIVMPKKYANENKRYSYVGGELVPFIPAQISHLKETRRSFDPIEEDTAMCDYCKSRSISSLDDEEDY
ncbi:unnamed protein product [Aphanomyces euteiches]